MAEQSTALATVGDAVDETQPKRFQYREIPSIQSFTEWDRVGQVRAILRELEQGQFQRASLLSILQSRDDRISGCWSIRTDTLLGIPLEFEPALIDGYVTDETQAIADAAEVDWPKMFQEGSLDRLFRQGKDLGLSLGELIVQEDEETGRWVPRFKPWHTQWVWWNWATESYWLNTSGAFDDDGNPVLDGAGVIELPRIEGDVYSDGHWVLYCPNGYRYAYLTGLIRETAMLHLKRQWDMRDWARYNEVYGLLIRKAITPAGATEPDKNRFAASIDNMGSEAVVECATDAAGNAFDIKIEGAPTGGGSATFGESLHYTDECLGNVILGQAASGEKKSGLGDGDQNQNEAVRQDILEKDARLYAILKLQVLSWWTLWNFGDRRLCPTPVAQVEPDESEQHAADTRLKQGQAATAIKAAWPNADMDALADEWGIPLETAEPGDDLVDDGEQPSLNGAQIASLLQIVGSVAAKQLPREAGIEMMMASFPIDRDQAERIMGEVGRSFFADPTTEAAKQTQLSIRALTAQATGKKRRPMLYTDRLATASREHAQRLMQPDIRALKAIIAESRSPADLRARLLSQYRSMDSRRLESLVEKCSIMAELEGQHNVIDGL